jgi:hypothetical protein
MLSSPWPARNAIYGQIYQCWVTSVSVFTQQQPERRFSRAVGFSHGVEKNFGTVNRAHSASTIDFPPPRFWQRRSLLYNDGKIGVVNHTGNNVSHRYRKMLWRPTIRHPGGIFDGSAVHRPRAIVNDTDKFCAPSSTSGNRWQYRSITENVASASATRVRFTTESGRRAAGRAALALNTIGRPR